LSDDTCKEDERVTVVHARQYSPQITRLRIATFALLAFVMAVSGTLVAAPAQASPRLEQVRNQVRDLEARAESATERYNQANMKLREVEENLKSLQSKAKRERRQMRKILGAVEGLARATYATGGVDPNLQVLLADDPTQFLAQASALDQVASSQAAALRRTQTQRIRLAQTEAAVAQKEQLASQYRNQMLSSKKDADARLAEANKLLNSLEAAERRRLARIAAQERRASAAAAAAALRAQSTRPGGSSSAGSFSGGGYAASGRAGRVVSYALQKVGMRYVAAAAGPTSFDCSGLTMQAWRQAGVGLPHYSRSQYAATRRVPLSEARPGDLVFYFGRGAHHVGLYIGNGKMVHAANPRSGVRIDNVLGPWYAQRFSGIGRVAGG
jgi:cell wall-associated NlpC family hydrolase